MMVVKNKTVLFLQLIVMVQKLLLGDKGIHLNRSVLQIVRAITPR